MTTELIMLELPPGILSLTDGRSVRGGSLTKVALLGVRGDDTLWKTLGCGYSPADT